MSYNLRFHDAALKEWRKLGAPVREQFKRKLAERLENPHVPAARIHAIKARYKIKFRASGFRLIYEVIDDELVVQVIAVGKRERGGVYGKARRRRSVGLSF